MKVRFPRPGRGSADGLLAMDGRIACPFRGEMDVEYCVDCPRLEAAREVEGGVLVRCRSGRTLEIPSVLAFLAR